MGELTNGMVMSLEGIVVDPAAYFEAEVFAFNDVSRKIDTEIHGRRNAPRHSGALA